MISGTPGSQNMTEQIEPATITCGGTSAVTQVFDSVKVSLADLCVKGRVQYAHKNYEQAADLYSRATELQAELNGEMNPENAEILFLYGRSLFKLGQSKSDVLGGGTGNKRKKRKSNTDLPSPSEVKDTEKEPTQTTIDKSSNISPQEDASETSTKKPDADIKSKLFQFRGDENFEESDEEAQNEEEDENDEDDEDDDLAAAFDVLDLARVLLEKKLEELEGSDSKEKAAADSPTLTHYRERLADTYDLLAEISLENERFPAAVADFRAALAYKKGLYDEERSVIAEAHFKLSLALEFASITSTEEDKNGKKEGADEMDQNLRDEAISEMEAAIRSTSLKLQAKETELSKLESVDDIETTRNQITEVKEMLSELRNRLEELKSPSVDVKSILYGPLTNGSHNFNATTNEESADLATARIEEAKKTANDVTGLVRKKFKVAEDQIASNIHDKRKSENAEESESKRTKLDEVTAT